MQRCNCECATDHPVPKPDELWICFGQRSRREGVSQRLHGVGWTRTGPGESVIHLRAIRNVLGARAIVAAGNPKLQKSKKDRTVLKRVISKVRALAAECAHPHKAALHRPAQAADRLPVHREWDSVVATLHSLLTPSPSASTFVRLLTKSFVLHPHLPPATTPSSSSVDRTPFVRYQLFLLSTCV